MKPTKAMIVSFDALMGQGTVRTEDGRTLRLAWNEIEGVDGVEEKFPPAHEMPRLERLEGLSCSVSVYRGVVTSCLIPMLPRCG